MALTSTPRTRRRAPTGPIVWIVLLILIVGGIFYLSSSVEEVPTKTIEVDVGADAQPSEG